MKNKDLVNKFFRSGIAQLLDFNPWEIKVLVETMEKHTFYSMLVDPLHMATIKQWTENWGLVINEYFTWNENRWPDPVAQCFHISQSSKKIHELLFTNINVNELKLEASFFTLYYSSAKYIDRLCEEIMGWALTHKFESEIFDDDFEK